jgi:hypothetical protein
MPSFCFIIVMIACQRVPSAVAGPAVAARVQTDLELEFLAPGSESRSSR